MTDKFSVITIDKLFNIIISDLKQGHIFGIPKSMFFKPSSSDFFKTRRFGHLLESPIGVAAGPHSQMAQNIIAAWLCGARYMELKTVQTLDELEISKPCIDMQDEGYNCEWSQELKIHQSYEQYLDAWILIHVLKKILGHDETEPGVIFNMSVGYNMEGIMNENVQWFFNKMKDCSTEKTEKTNRLKNIYPEISQIIIPDCISDNITLSTMHGCPPEEIEKIGRYLIENKKLHTTIKLNPTLLGSAELRDILNNKLGFGTVVPDEAFGHDLKYPDALNLIKSLQESAKKYNVFFGLKLTNTLESINNKDVLPPNEKMMYMSGRALHPISVNVAKKLQNDFNGSLDISFSAGADCFNISDIIKCGLYPVTVCSDILKPGGYGRLLQYFETIEKTCNAEIFNEKHKNQKNYLDYLNQYAAEVTSKMPYVKNPFISPSVKTSRQLNFFDCIKAPCVDTCPTNQDIPEYLYHTAQGNFQKAWEVILQTNPFPNVLGMVCDHTCQLKCTRINYDSPLLIREVKRFISEQNNNTNMLQPKEKNNISAAIIGAGPSGLACAYFLALEGFSVDVYETKSFSGGMVSDAIPAFRLTDDAIKKDVDRIVKLGVNIHYNTKVDYLFFENLKLKNNYIYIAIGAQGAKRLNIENETADGVLNPLTFLSDIRRGKNVSLGKNIIVIGGGNTAMDVARTAKRAAGKDAKITVVYRRTKYEMPADVEEVQALIHENIEIAELTAPEKLNIENNKIVSITCSKMKLGETDSSGRAKPVKILNSEFDIPCDSLIPALGQDVKLDFINCEKIEINENNYETQFPNIFIGGDAMRGGATIIKAVADGKKVSASIFEKAKITHNFKKIENNKGLQFEDYIEKKSLRESGIFAEETPLSKRNSFELVIKSLSNDAAMTEAARCLYCDDVCNVCVTVCPNRANYSYFVEPKTINLQKIILKDGKPQATADSIFELKQTIQVLNISDFCNECGNCTTFCPTSGRPFADKPKLCLTAESFKMADNAFLINMDNENEVIHHKSGNIFSSLQKTANEYIYESSNVKVSLYKQDLSVKEIIYADASSGPVSLQQAAIMSILIENVKI